MGAGTPLAALSGDWDGAADAGLAGQRRVCAVRRHELSVIGNRAVAAPVRREPQTLASSSAAGFACAARSAVSSCCDERQVLLGSVTIDELDRRSTRTFEHQRTRRGGGYAAGAMQAGMARRHPQPCENRSRGLVPSEARARALCALSSLTIRKPAEPSGAVTRHRRTFERRRPTHSPIVDFLEDDARRG
jgi:hypothetical protein